MGDRLGRMERYPLNFFYFVVLFIRFRGANAHHIHDREHVELAQELGAGWILAS